MSSRPPVPLVYATRLAPSVTRRGSVQGGVLFVVTILVALAGASVYVERVTARDRDCSALRCPSHLRQYGQLFTLYANENKGHFPPDLYTAFTTQDGSSDLLRCSQSAATPATLPSRETFDAACDYIYTGAGLHGNVPPDIITAFDRGPNHPGFRWVLFADGQVERIDTPDLLAAFARSDAARTQWQKEQAAKPSPLSAPAPALP